MLGEVEVTLVERKWLYRHNVSLGRLTWGNFEIKETDYNMNLAHQINLKNNWFASL